MTHLTIARPEPLAAATEAGRRRTDLNRWSRLTLRVGACLTVCGPALADSPGDAWSHDSSAQRAHRPLLDTPEHGPLNRRTIRHPTPLANVLAPRSSPAPSAPSTRTLNLEHEEGLAEQLNRLGGDTGMVWLRSRNGHVSVTYGTSFSP